MIAGAANQSLMVIDDDPELRDMLEDMFRPRRFDVVTAPDGEEGLRLSHERTRAPERTRASMTPPSSGFSLRFARVEPWRASSS